MPEPVLAKAPEPEMTPPSVSVFPGMLAEVVVPEFKAIELFTPLAVSALRVPPLETIARVTLAAVV